MANVPVTISRAIVIREGATPSSPPSFEDDPDPINQPGSGGDGVNNFIELNDTPASYTGEAGKVVAVKSGEDGLEFTTISLANTHNDLVGLQGGATGQYYHLTEDEYDAILNAATTPDATNPFVTAADLGAAGLGTVTSVGLTAPDIFSISGSPVTSAGTLGLTFTSQSEFTVLARGSGAGVPSFQALVAGHIPNLAISKITNLQSSLDAKLSNTLTSAQIFVGNSSNVATGRALTLNASGGTFGLSNTGVLTFPNASTSLRGLLTSADWNTFNSKQNALGFTPENVANKSTNTALGTSNVLYPTQNAVKVYVDTGLGTKQNTITGAATTITSANLTTNRALISNGSGKVAVSAITSTELGYLSGVTSAIQTQLNGKQNILTNPVTGTGSIGQVSFWTGANTQAGSNNLFYNAGTATLGIGTNSLTNVSRLRALANNAPNESINVRIDNTGAIGTSGSVTNLFVRGDSGGTGFGDTLVTNIYGEVRKNGDRLLDLYGDRGADNVLRLLGNGSLFLKGNVGIGTTSPSARLDVNGNVACDDPTLNRHAVTLGYLNSQESVKNISSGVMITSTNAYESIFSAGSNISGGNLKTFDFSKTKIYDTILINIIFRNITTNNNKLGILRFQLGSGTQRFLEVQSNGTAPYSGKFEIKLLYTGTGYVIHANVFTTEGVAGSNRHVIATESISSNWQLKIDFLSGLVGSGNYGGNTNIMHEISYNSSNDTVFV